MKIETIGELKEYFWRSDSPLCDGVYVSTKIRNEWMLNHQRVVVHGIVYDIEFINHGGGVWRANLKE